MGPFLGVPIIRTIVFWGLYWGPLFLGNYHICPHVHVSVASPVYGGLQRATKKDYQDRSTVDVHNSEHYPKNAKPCE